MVKGTSFLLWMGRWCAANACFTRSDSVAGCLPPAMSGSGFGRGAAHELDAAPLPPDLAATGISLILSSWPRKDSPATTASVLCET